MAHYLKSMTDFVISQWDKDITREEFSQRMIRKATFLKRQPTKGDFVPCDLEGNVLRDPGLIPSYELEEYRKAKERVLFKGWTVGEFGFLNLEGVSCLNLDPFKSIEELIIYGSIGIELTDNAAKMLGYE